MESPIEKYPRVGALFEEIKRHKEEDLIELAKKILEYHGGALHFDQLFLMAMINRAVNNIDAFLDSFKKWNIDVCGVLLRNILENFIIVFYIEKIGDKRIIDRYFETGRIQKLNKKNKWIHTPYSEMIEAIKDDFVDVDVLYDDCCKAVHFSLNHVYNMIHGKEIKGITTLSVGVGNRTVDEDELSTILKAVVTINSALIGFLNAVIKKSRETNQGM